MVHYVAHRQNKLKRLQTLKKNSFNGIEFDLRSFEKKIVIEHDAFKKGLEFFGNFKYLKNFFLLIDIKSSDIYHRVIRFLKKKKF